MKKHMLFLILVLMSAQAMAQVESQNIDMDVDSEIDQMYQQPRTTNTQSKKSNKTSIVNNQTVVVPQTTVQSHVQTQPTTFVEASPLSDSKADYIRKNRQDEEMKTESRIVEKLEQSRMEDEKKRAAVLFGDKFDSLQNQQSVPQATPVQIAPAPQPIQPIQPIIIEERETLSRDAVREEVRAALNEDSMAITGPLETRYFSGMAGIGYYPDVKNVNGNYSLGAAFGTRYDYFMVEGGFLMSNYGVDVNNYSTYRVDSYDVNQFQGSMAAKYQLMSGMVRPVLGGLIAYSYRKYALTNNYLGSSEDTGNSHAIDLGVNAGVDLEFSPQFALGFDFKYMFNMSSRVNSNYANSSYGYVGTPLEKLQYSITSIVARVNF